MRLQEFQQDRVQRMLQKMPQDDPRRSEVYKMLLQEPLKKRIDSYIRVRGDDDAIAAIDTLTQTIMNIDPDLQKIKPFLSDIKNKVDFVDVEKLIPKKGVLQREMISSIVNHPYAKQIFNTLRNYKPPGKSDAGPYEASLAILSPVITYAPEDEEGETGGDLKINGKKIEVKAMDGGPLWDPGKQILNMEPITAWLKKNKMYDMMPNRAKGASKVAGVTTFGGKPGPQGFDKIGFMKEVCKVWFGGNIEKLGEALFTPSFPDLWANAVFTAYKKHAGHEGVLSIGEGNFQYFTSGSQLKGQRLDYRGMYWEKPAGQIRRDILKFKI